ncbi:SMI1/KNR4 family protein [Prescottella agglutinans]|uniref:SMI1/KNR4 family protein n=1 Tax=Prescottella agglutinans TaxID=1644129 RepID=UPI003D97062A
MTTLTEVWRAYISVLRDVAPVTAAAVRPPRGLLDRQEAEETTTPWSAELREFYSLHDGMGDVPSTQHSSVGTVLPDLELLGLDALVATHISCREPRHRIDDLGPDWPETIDRQVAGEVAHRFLDPYVPFAQYGTGDFLYVDTRFGDRHGCVRAFGWEVADESGPLFASLADYIDSVRHSVEAGTEHSYLTPTVEDGALVWTADDADIPAHEPPPVPIPLQIPFPLIDFGPSQVWTTDDLLDLDAVERAVLATARSLHPDAVIDGAHTVYSRVPRQRGIHMNFFVSVNGETTCYLTIVTGVGNNVIVHEVPPQGFTIVSGD